MSQIDRPRESGPYHRWNIVPNTTSLASYSFATQTIALEQIDSAQYRAATTGGPLARRNLTILLMHELRHWLDHVGTLWGQKLLVDGYNAHHARIGNIETDFRQIITYYRKLRDNRFERFYTTMGRKEPNGQRRWKSQMSAGYRYDHDGRLNHTHPIAFTRFSWQDGALACRVPFSTAALLEASATYYEMKTEEFFVPLLSEASREPAYTEIQRRMIENAYSVELAEYSIAVHAVSNALELSDCPSAFHAVSLLASLSLNIPSSLFDRIKHPPEFSLWGETRQRFLERRDRGYAFLALVRSAPPFDPGNAEAWVEATLQNTGLPGLTEVKRLAQTEMLEVASRLSEGEFFARATKQLTAGRDLFDKFGPLYKVNDVLEATPDSPLPPITLSDDTIAADGAIAPWGQSPAAGPIDRILSVQAQENEFVDACGL